MKFQNATFATKNRIIYLARNVAYEFVPLAIMVAFVAIVRTITVDPTGYRRQFPDGRMQAIIGTTKAIAKEKIPIDRSLRGARTHPPARVVSEGPK